MKYVILFTGIAGFVFWFVVWWMLPQTAFYSIMGSAAGILMLVLLAMHHQRKGQYAHWEMMKENCTTIFCGSCKTYHGIPMFCEKCGTCLFAYGNAVPDKDVILARCGNCYKINSVYKEQWETYESNN